MAWVPNTQAPSMPLNLLQNPNTPDLRQVVASLAQQVSELNSTVRSTRASAPTAAAGSQRQLDASELEPAEGFGHVTDELQVTEPGQRNPLRDPYSGRRLTQSRVTWSPSLISRFMPVTNGIAQENVPVILREIADGLQRSFESETSPLDRYTSVLDTLTEDKEDDLLVGEDDDLELVGDD